MNLFNVRNSSASALLNSHSLQNSLPVLDNKI